MTMTNRGRRLCEESGVSRRQALKIGARGIALGLAGAVSPLPPLFGSASKAVAATEGKILVVFEWFGGYDGLSTFVPYSNDALYRQRPNIGVREADVLKVDEHFGFQKSMLGMHRLWNEGNVAVVHGAGYDQPSFSHFTSASYWHTGAPNSGEEYGWYGRTADALDTVAGRLRAVAVVDGPSTTDAAAKTEVAKFDSRRLYFVDPAVLVGSPPRAEPASARVAGVIARSDAERGFWASPSNRPVAGVAGTARPVDFELGDPASRANILNEARVATVVHRGGYRLWGNRSTASDARWQFLSVARTADAIDESILRSHAWAVDRNITKSYLADVAEGVNAYLRELVGRGAILGGRAWIDPDLNTAATFAAGKVVISFDFTPPAPAERITFRSELVDDYLKELV